MIFDWNRNKDEVLRKERQIGFSQIIIEIEQGNFRVIDPHPDKEKYPNQVLFCILLNDYIYVVPAVKQENCYFLKTIYPSRKMSKSYRKGEFKI